LGLAALPLRFLVPLGRLWLGLGLGFRLGSGVGQLVLVARLRRLVSIGLLLGMVLAALLPLLRLPSLAVSARWAGLSGLPRRRRRPDAASRCDSEARGRRRRRRGSQPPRIAHPAADRGPRSHWQGPRRRYGPRGMERGLRPRLREPPPVANGTVRRRSNARQDRYRRRDVRTVDHSITIAATALGGARAGLPWSRADHDARPDADHGP
jgi:hypothetical protein